MKRRRGGVERRRKTPEKERPLNPEGLKNLKILLENVAAYSESSLGIGVDAENSMRMDWFEESGYYSKDEIEKDKEKVHELERGFSENDAQKTDAEKEKMKVSKIFEQSVAVIFHYAMRAKNLAVVSTTPHTDYLDGVDSLVIHKQTGQIICAIDETNSNIHNIIHGSKLNNIVKRNKEEKIIKYGVALNTDGKWYPSELKRKDAPLAYLSMPQEKITKFVDDLAKIDPQYNEDIAELCDDLFTDLIYSLYQSLDHVMVNIPEHRT